MAAMAMINEKKRETIRVTKVQPVDDANDAYRILIVHVLDYTLKRN